MYGEVYASLEAIKDAILYKRVISATEDEVKLENGVSITIECTEYDCCAGGGGAFNIVNGRVPLDAVITDINVGEQKEIPDDDTRVTENTITLLHNQNPIIEANAVTDAGNGGYYYSVTSLIVNDIKFPFVEA